MAEIMGIFGEDIDQWWAWFFELKATAEAAEENVSLLPSDVPAPPAEPEGLWDYLKEKSEESPGRLGAKAVANCLSLLAFSRALRQRKKKYGSR